MNCSDCGFPALGASPDGMARPVDLCLPCVELELAEANRKLQRLAVVESWLRHIQESVVNSHWQTMGGLYRGKEVFLSQDVLNAMDSALDGEVVPTGA